MISSYSEIEALAHIGQISSENAVPVNGPYAQSYEYDVYGNRTHIGGWGGVARWEDNTFTNNRQNGLQYDAAGNLTYSGWYRFAYDVTGRQTRSTCPGYLLDAWYDGDALRVKKTEQGVTTYYVRSSMLGGQVVAEINASGGWQRGYVYLGLQNIAIQESNAVTFVHQDPVAKSQRLTDSAGTVVSIVELDPYGAHTNRSWQELKQPHRFTTYERDGDGQDDAMARTYNRWWARFNQPDPYDGSYNLADPQSLNRYSYVQNDPVNFIDPSGLDFCWGEVLISDPWNVPHNPRFPEMHPSNCSTRSAGSGGGGGGDGRGGGIGPAPSAERIESRRGTAKME